MSEYLEKVILATGGHAAPLENLEAQNEEAPEGYHYMPDGTLMKDSEHEDEAALEKDSDDPCWSGYVQVGMKKKNGKRVPNCVPSSAAIDFIVDSNSREFGVSRHVAKEDAYAVARKAYEKYDYLEDDQALYSAIIYDLVAYLEYATTGTSEEGDDLAMFSSHLPDGHPSVDSSLTAAINWVAGASDLTHSGREAVLRAFSDSSDYIDALHSSTRLKVLISSGGLSETTTEQIKALSTKHSKVD